MKSRSLLLLGILFLPGCNGLFPQPPEETGDASLKAFTSEEEFRNFLRGEIETRNSSLADSNMLFNRSEAIGAPEADAAAGPTDSAPAPSAPVSGGALADDDGSGGDFSQTTQQEVGVDEADVVKTDGRYIYMIDDSSGEGSKLRIVQAAPANQMAVVSELALDGYGREIYLHEGTIVALTATYGGFYYSGGPEILTLAADAAAAQEVDADTDAALSDSAVTDVAPLVGEDGEPPADDVVDPAPDPSIGLLPPYRYDRPTVTATVIDATDPANPRVVSKTKFDGSPSSSRMIGGVLHLVLANYQNYYFDVMPRLGLAEFDAQSVEVESLLPRFEQTDAAGVVTTGDVVTWQDVYRPAEPDGFGVVTIVSLDTANNSSLRASGIVAEPGLIYSSLNALYLTNTQYDFVGNMRTNTKVYKLGYTDGRAVPSSGGSVPGRILNQYSMSEHNGVLRVATTVDPVFSSDGNVTSSNNNVYCLTEAEGVLNVVGRVENIAPRETIQSARFVGDKGFVVTFEQIDPLFTLDLSDPTNPRIVGELKVPGFSTFMVPLDENHLLAVGQHVPEERFLPGGVQLSIFDVSDFANPVQRHNVVIGGENGAWSEALYDPKALTFFAESGLLALPINIHPKYDYGVPIDFIDIGDGDGAGVRPDGEASGGGSSGSATGSTGATTPPSDSGDSPASPIAVEEPALLDPGFEGVVVYQVSAAGGFTELGRISTRYEQPGYYAWNSFTRGVFIDEDVYAVTNLGIRAVPTSSVATSTPFEIFYGQLYPMYEEPVAVDPIFMEGDSVKPEAEPNASDPDTTSSSEMDTPAGSVVPPSEPAYNPGPKK